VILSLVKPTCWQGKPLQIFVPFCQLLSGLLEQSSAQIQTRKKQCRYCRVHHILPPWLLSLRP